MIMNQALMPGSICTLPPECNYGTRILTRSAGLPLFNPKSSLIWASTIEGGRRRAILEPSASGMPFKLSRKPKTTDKGTHTPGSSSSVQSSSSRRQQVYDTVNIGLDLVANIAEASDVLAPLKAACKATQSIIQVVQVSSPNRRGFF